jgi:lipooligosaccharide transport system permease protein
VSTRLPTATLPLRIFPPVIRDARRPQRLMERSFMVYRRTWLLIVSGFFEPLLYLLSFKVGLGELVGDVTVGGKTVSYAAFVAPALMASSAMNGAVYDSTMNVFHKLKYARIYDAVLATPVGVGDVALGEIGFALLRGQLYASMFLVVMWAMGLVASPWVILALPACALIGAAFAAVGMASTTFMRGWVDFEYVAVVTMPLFLFSATFAPLSAYSPAVRWLVQLSPLYHGVALVRLANAGVWEWAALGHIAFLVVMAVVGIRITARRLAGLLLS